METLIDQILVTHVAPPTLHHEPKRILVADDDSMMCGLVTATLEDAGHQVKTASNGEVAWAALLAENYDLLVTADIMPKVSGLALVRRIRVAAMVLPVIVASERLDAEDAAALNRDPWSRFDAFVRKPFTMSDLLAAVRSVLARIKSPR
jgi:DNA-binding response OmpR family regulator